MTIAIKHCTRTIIPSPNQVFQGTVVRVDHFSWNFGPPDQFFHQTKISMTGPDLSQWEEESKI